VEALEVAGFNVGGGVQDLADIRAIVSSQVKETEDLEVKGSV
jgi:hypothetical protein